MWRQHESPEPEVRTAAWIAAATERDFDVYLDDVRNGSAQPCLTREEISQLSGTQKAQILEKLRRRNPHRRSLNNPHVVNVRRVEVFANNIILKTARARKPPFTSVEPYHFVERPGSPGKASRQRKETIHYHDLVKDGGRPLYPIELLEDVFARPLDNMELIRPLIAPPWVDERLMSKEDFQLGRKHIFEEQWARWNDFLNWQFDNRSLTSPNEELPRYTEHYERKGRMCKYWASLDKFRANPDTFKEELEEKRKLTVTSRGWIREKVDGDIDLGKYEQAVRKRLATHGVPNDLTLKPHPDQQDKLTTWFEYLNYELWWYDHYVSEREVCRSSCDEARKNLVRSGYKFDEKKQKFPRVQSDHLLERAQHARSEMERAAPGDALEAAERRFARLESHYKWLLTYECDHVALLRYIDLVRRETLVVEWVKSQIPLVKQEQQQTQKHAAGPLNSPTPETGAASQESTTSAQEQAATATPGEATATTSPEPAKAASPEPAKAASPEQSTTAAPVQSNAMTTVEAARAAPQQSTTTASAGAAAKAPQGQTPSAAPNASAAPSSSGPSRASSSSRPAAKTPPTQRGKQPDKAQDVVTRYGRESKPVKGFNPSDYYEARTSSSGASRAATSSSRRPAAVKDSKTRRSQKPDQPKEVVTRYGRESKPVKRFNPSDYDKEPPQRPSKRPRK